MENKMRQWLLLGTLGASCALYFSVTEQNKPVPALKAGSGTVAGVAFGIALVGGLSIVAATAVRRPWAAHLALAVLVLGSLAVAYLVLTAPLAAPGFARDLHTGVPVGTAFPGYARVLTAPFNIAGALCLVFGAAFSAYVYMPKNKVLATGSVKLPVLAQAWYFAVAVVNFFASLPGAAVALFAGRLNSRVPATILIALGGLIPGVTSGLNRFGVTWSFFLGEFLGVVLIFTGFLVSEDVFSNLRVFVAGTIWRREGREEKVELAG